MKFNATLLLIALLAAGGCGKKIQHTNQEKALSEVRVHMDMGDYEKAIRSLEELQKRYPNSEEIRTQLLHSYAGAGSFEAIKVVGIWKEVQSLLKEMKNQQEDHLRNQAKLGLDNFAIELEKVLAPIPELTKNQHKRLNQAIDLYQEMGMSAENAGKYNNFKWGTLHVYRLAVNVKTMVQEAKRIQLEGQSLDLKALERALIPKLKVIGQDVFMAYKLFGNSFDKIKKITAGVDELIAKTVNDKDFKLKINTIAKNEGEFYSSLIKENINAASVLIRKVGEIYVENGHRDRLDSAIKASLPSEQEIYESQRRIEALVKIFIENFTSEHPEVEEKIKSIFTEKLKREIIAAARDSIKEKNTNPLKELLHAKSPEVEVLNAYLKLLRNEIEASDIEENIQEELDGLKSKVDLELLKDELKAIAQALNEDTKVVQIGAESILYKTRDEIEDRQRVLQKEITWLQKYLGDASKGLKQSLDSEDMDREEMNQIIEDTKIFVES